MEEDPDKSADLQGIELPILEEEQFVENFDALDFREIAETDEITPVNKVPSRPSECEEDDWQSQEKRIACLNA